MLISKAYTYFRSILFCCIVFLPQKRTLSIRFANLFFATISQQPQIFRCYRFYFLYFIFLTNWLFHNVSIYIVSKRKEKKIQNIPWIERATQNQEVGEKKIQKTATVWIKKKSGRSFHSGNFPLSDFESDATLWTVTENLLRCPCQTHWVQNVCSFHSITININTNRIHLLVRWVRLHFSVHAI